MKDQDFNKLDTNSEGTIKSFVVLASGAIVKFQSESQSHKKNERLFQNGRVVVGPVPNGLSFATLSVKVKDIIAEGDLTHPVLDVRQYEEQADRADRQL